MNVIKRCARRAPSIDACLYEDTNHIYLKLQRRHFSNSRPFANNQWSIVSPRSSDGPLSQRRCLVTGGTSGIGAAVVKALLQHGVSAVTLVSSNSGHMRPVIGEMKQIYGSECPIGAIKYDLKTSVNSDLFFDRWREASEKHYFPLFDTVINCKGISQESRLQTTSTDIMSDILQVNLKFPMQVSRRLLRDYTSFGKQLDRGNGTANYQPKSFCVVNISSLLADRGGEGASVYAASKAGLNAFTRALTLEAAATRLRFSMLPPFRANVVAPGYIDTKMTQTFKPEYRENVTAKIPLRRFGTPEEVADAVIFLVQNEYANNTVLNLDGGLSAV